MRTINFVRSTLIACTAGSVLMLAGAASAQPANPTPFQQRVIEAMQGDIRTEKDRARDANRMPAEVLEFFRMREDMRVLEVLPASGWYTKILGPVLKDKGKLYVTHPPGLYQDIFQPVRELAGLENVEEIDWNGHPSPTGGFFNPSGQWDVEPVDLVLTFRNYHNFSSEDRMDVNESSYDALKPGGYYGIVDHTRRHMEPGNEENGRRIDPVLNIKEVLDAGFIFVDFTDVLARPQDALALEVANPAVTGQSDRYTLLFQKPE
jgi:predicted methyltransferase